MGSKDQREEKQHFLHFSCPLFPKARPEHPSCLRKTWEFLRKGTFRLDVVKDLVCLAYMRC